MKLKDYFLIALVAWGLVMTYTTVDNSEAAEHERIEKERAEERHARYIDSMHIVVNRKDEQILKVMRQSAEFEMIAKDAVKQAEKDKKRYENIKFYAPRNDFERDSLRAKALGR